jgi:hypothetical protein
MMLEKKNCNAPHQLVTKLIAVSLILLFCNISQIVDGFLASTPTRHASYRCDRRRLVTAIPLVSSRNYNAASLSLDDDEGDDVDTGDLLNSTDWDLIEEADNSDEEEGVDSFVEDEAKVGVHDESEVNDIFQEWLSIREEDRSTSLPKISVIPQLVDAMDSWNITFYNHLLQLLSKNGSIRDSEALLYHMIQEKRFINDESFYHVYTSYSNHEYQRRSKKKRNNRKWGTAFKLEQLLALQDAMVGCTPTARTLQAVLRALAEDRTDVKVAVRARRIWDRLVTLSDEEAPVASAASLLQACAHVPSDAAADEKLEAFTIALEVFNGVTTELRSDQQPRIYIWFLRACRKLLASTAERKRDAVVEAAFRRACMAGVVNTAVLKSLSEVASDACMLRLLGGFLEDGIETPLDWSRNCVLQRSTDAQATQEMETS